MGGTLAFSPFSSSWAPEERRSYYRRTSLEEIIRVFGFTEEDIARIMRVPGPLVGAWCASLPPEGLGRRLYIFAAQAAFLSDERGCPFRFTRPYRRFPFTKDDLVPALFDW